MTPNPVDIVAGVIAGYCGTDPAEHREEATAALEALRQAGLEIVRFGTGVPTPPPMPLWSRQCDGAILVERWQRDDSQLRPPTPAAAVTPAGRLVDLMAALEESAAEAKASRQRQQGPT